MAHGDLDGHRNQHLAAKRPGRLGFADLHPQQRLPMCAGFVGEQQPALGLHVGLGTPREIDVATARTHAQAGPPELDAHLVGPVVAAVLRHEAEPVVVRGVFTDSPERSEVRPGHVGPAARLLSDLPQVLPAHQARPPLLIHRIDGVAEDVGGVDQRVEDAPVRTEADPLARQPKRADRPVARQQQQDLAAFRHVERPHRGTDRCDGELEIPRQTLCPRFARRTRQVHRRERQVGGYGGEVFIESGARRQTTVRVQREARLVDQSRRPQQTTERAPALEFRQRGAGPPAVRRERAEDLQPAAALHDDRDLIQQTEVRQLVGEPADNGPPERHVSVIVVDEQEIVRRHRVALADRRRRLPSARLHRPVLQDLGEIVDSHLQIVHEDPEIVGVEPMHPVPRPVLDHHLQVDHPDVDLLAEEEIRGRFVRLPGRRLRFSRLGPGEDQSSREYE